ncbi:LOW QUALITY PROTEIN: hypothetical protein ACHAXS_001602 [Conticribra weissflogii]
MSKLEEAIFMDCPKGLERAKHEDALVLKKSVYGKKGIVFIAIYIDDNLLVGNEVAIAEVIKLLQKEGFKNWRQSERLSFAQCSFLEIMKRSMARTNIKLKLEVWEVS